MVANQGLYQAIRIDRKMYIYKSMNLIDTQETIKKIEIKLVDSTLRQVANCNINELT